MDKAAFEMQAKVVSIEDREVFERYYHGFSQTICEYTFAQMLLWGESRKHLWCEIDDHLVVAFQKTGEDRIWYQPTGSDPARIIREHLSPSDGFSFLYVDEETASALSDECAAHETPERFDYVYDVSKLRSLEGKDYAEKRNFIRRAEKCQPEIICLNAGCAHECQSMLERWMTMQPIEGMNSLTDEYSSLRLAMEHFEELGLIGVGVRINGQLEALSLGVELNSTTFVEYFQKSTNCVAGLYPLILHELVKHLPDAYTHINLEEDLGLPGLRTAKQRWHPAYLVKKYAIEAK